MYFSQALEAMRSGHRAARRMWRDMGGQVGVHIEIVTMTTADGRASLPMLMVTLPDGTLVQFTGGSWDLLADDWEVLS